MIATTCLRDFQLCATSVKTGEQLFRVGEKDKGEYSKKIAGQVEPLLLFDQRGPPMQKNYAR